MKKYIQCLGLALMAVCSIQLSAAPANKATLTGMITDAADSTPLVGATLYFPDLKNGGATDINGRYRIENLPAGSFLLQVSMLGYATLTQKIVLTENTVLNLRLEKTPTEMPGVVITGLSSSADKNRTPTPITVISAQQLQQNASSNIIDAIAKQPGVSQRGTGPGISKPVIRGLGYNRVVVVNDGIRQEGQQWGDEHGIEIDEFSVSRVEILKGPASLTYGSDAMAGVVNILSAPTLPQGTIAGNFSENYQTNNGLNAFSGNFGGNSKGFIWDARYTHKQAHDYFNRYDGGVFDSRFIENDFSAMAGLNRSWGYSHISFSAYSLIPGIVEGARDSATGKFVKETATPAGTVADSIVTDTDLHSYQFSTPHQEIAHYKANWNSSFIIGDGMLKTIVGFQENQRKEFADVLHPDRYGLYFFMNTVNYDVRYIFPEKNKIQLSTGINGMQQHSQNKGSEYLVPEYSLFDIGAFVTARRSWEKLDLSGGIRFDTRFEKTGDLFLDTNGVKTEHPDATSYHRFAAFDGTYSGISGSMGASWLFTKDIYMKGNVSRGFRAPNIGEIGSNGVHEGTIQYLIGDPGLKPESSLQFDYAFDIDSKHISAEIDLFGNSIRNYIYARKLNSVNGGDSVSEGYATLKFVQGNAVLNGGEISFDLHPHPLDWLHFENSFGFVIAQQKNASDSTKYLPFTPAPVLRSELKANLSKGGKIIRNGYVKIEVENTFAQHHIYTAFATETATPGYTLLNAGTGADFVRGGNVLFTFNLSVNNITDVAYQSHLSRLKYADVNNVTGRVGVYNMGRNVSLKLNIPLYFRKSAVTN